MGAREKRARVTRPPKHDGSKPEDTGSGVFDVPSHGRLVRRGSTEVTSEDQPAGRGATRGASPS
jgi:hypothetical protein